jgi:hypothetical protein
VTRSATEEWPRALKALRAAMESLPSEEEIAESVRAIDEIMAFLTDLRRRLSEQPARREDLQKATLLLESFLSGHRGQVLFTESRKTGRAAQGENADVGELRHELEQLPLEDVRARLLDESLYPVAMLRELARELGLRLDARLPRADLADAIYKRGFANPRGYQALRDVSHIPRNAKEPRSEARVGGHASSGHDEMPQVKVARRG